MPRAKSVLWWILGFPVRNLDTVILCLIAFAMYLLIVRYEHR